MLAHGGAVQPGANSMRRAQSEGPAVGRATKLAAYAGRGAREAIGGGGSSSSSTAAATTTAAAANNDKSASYRDITTTATGGAASSSNSNGHATRKSRKVNKGHFYEVYCSIRLT